MSGPAKSCARAGRVMRHGADGTADTKTDLLFRVAHLFEGDGVRAQLAHDALPALDLEAKAALASALLVNPDEVLL